MRVARAIGWAHVADALREHLHACCFALGLLLVAAACPYIAPLRSIKLLPAALNAVAFPLVGVIMATVPTLLCSNPLLILSSFDLPLPAPMSGTTI